MGLTRRTLLRAGGLATATAAATVTSQTVTKLAGAAAVPVYKPDVLVIGAGTGGVAAALALLKAGRTVVLTEQTGWLGGQLSVQGVPPDEHEWIEKRLGATPSYCDLRTAVRNYVKATYPLKDGPKNDPLLDPGNGWPRLSAEPRIWQLLLRRKLQPYQDNGKLILLTLTRIQSAVVSSKRVTSVLFSRPLGRQAQVQATYVIDATEHGDLLPLAGIPFVVGREPGAGPGGTGELHNKWATADPMSQQPFTVVVAAGWGGRAGEPVSSPLYKEFEATYKKFGTGTQKDVFDPSKEWPWSQARNFWPYRRVRWHGYLTDPKLGDISLLNQPENDFLNNPLIPASGPTDLARYAKLVQRAGQQSLGLVEYFQKYYPRPDGSGNGWPGLYLVKDALGTSSGLAATPYIRESRRIKAEFTVTEKHIGVQNRNGQGPILFNDSVGIGAGPIDVHPNPSVPYGLYVQTYPYQIPFSALIPKGWTNVLAGAKNLGVTWLTNGCYRFHPTEWSIGEAAGLACAFAIGRKLPLRSLLDRGTNFASFAAWLEGKGIKRAWPTTVAARPVSYLVS